MSTLLHKAGQYYISGTHYITLVTPILDLALRIWVATIFFQSGLTKIQSWDATLALFEYEYAVPLLPHNVAAWLGTGAELILPVLLLIGFISRPTALALFIFNFVAVISYPDISLAGIKDHMIWGLILAVSFMHGPGKLSLDYWWYSRLQSKGSTE